MGMESASLTHFFKVWQIYLQGANSYGQLGLGHTEDKLLPSAVQIETSKARTLKQITGGGGHTILLTSKQ